MTEIRKKILFVDNDANLLDLIQQLMARFAGHTWDICAAQDVSQAPVTLRQQPVDSLMIHRGVADVPDGSKDA